jgi:hypothetical protein
MDDTTADTAEAQRRSARNLADVGELTAQWLEGKHSPTLGCNGGVPDEETELLVPILAAANRTGFVTHQSQPGMPLDEHGCAQRANVSGYAGPETFARLMAAISDADLIVTAARALDDSEERQFGPLFAVTLDEGEEFTWDGIALSRPILERDYGDWHPAVVRELCAAWQVTIIDPVRGRNDVLWTVLEKLAAAPEPSA